MDLRAPLHGECGGDGASSTSNSDISAPWWENNMSASSAIDSRLYEKIIHCHLCRMYVASQAMELGTESRFTGLVLFHRYVRQFYRSVQEKKHVQQTSREVMKQISAHLGTVAAACLFLGCKMEEEPRRIRDVINLSHILKFSFGDIEKSVPTANVDDSDSPTKKISSKPVTIIELPSPPPLDETYWIAKEQMVSTEQHVLRMIQFDTSVCHPHRCVLIIMEILGFGKGKYQSDVGGGGSEQRNWLLSPNQSESLISRSWMLLNDASLDGKGVALQYPVILLSCAAISLADEGTINDSSNCNGAAEVLILPEFWWRELHLTDENFIIAKNALQKRSGR